MRREPVTLTLQGATSVSGLFLSPDEPSACYVMAHGAGAGMAHPFMEAVAGGLAERRIATLRYQFPFMEKGSKRTDNSTIAHAAVRAAVGAAQSLLPNIPLIAGGKSFGARMTSQAQAEMPLPGVCGLAFFGFPLHPPGKPSAQRAVHLDAVKVPMLFLQGTRDTLAGMGLLKPLVERLGKYAALSEIEHADHSFHVLVRSGRTDEQVMSELLDLTAAWIGKLKLDHAR